MKIDQHSAITWSNGLKIDSVIGVDLSIKTGFTSKAAQNWKFTAAGQLCGTNDSALHAVTIVAR